MRYLAPAVQGGQRLNLNLGRTDTSTNPAEVKGLNPNKPITINCLRAMQEIADRWVDRGCYGTPDRALRALVGGET